MQRVSVLSLFLLQTDCSHQRDEFKEAMRSLEGLPIWVVVRLCTDQENVVQFNNDLDADLELSLEVLDNYIDEANEIQATNS